MDDLQLFLRISEPVHQLTYTLKTQPRTAGCGLLQISQCFILIHFLRSLSTCSANIRFFISRMIIMLSTVPIARYSGTRGNTIGSE